MEEGLCGPGLRKYVGKDNVHEARVERLYGCSLELNFFKNALGPCL